MALPRGMRHAVQLDKHGRPKAAPKFGLVKVKSQVRKPNPETGRKRWTPRDPKPERRPIAVTKFARGDRFGRAHATALPIASATETWRGRRVAR